MVFSAAYNLLEFIQMANFLDSGQVDARGMISETIPLDGVGDAIIGLRSGTREAIKIHVDPYLT